MESTKRSPKGQAEGQAELQGTEGSGALWEDSLTVHTVFRK